MNLYCVRELEGKIVVLEDRLEQLREACGHLVPIRDGMPHEKSLESRVEKISQELIDVERELEETKAEQRLRGAELTIEIMRHVHGRLARILICRYILLQRFKQIARELGVSEARTYKLHQEAIEVLLANGFTLGNRN